MKRISVLFVLIWLGMIVLGTGLAHGQPSGSIEAWGYNSLGQCDVPEPNGAADKAGDRLFSVRCEGYAMDFAGRFASSRLFRVQRDVGDVELANFSTGFDLPEADRSIAAGPATAGEGEFAVG